MYILVPYSGNGVLVIVNTHQVVAQGVADVLGTLADEVVEREGTVNHAQVVIDRAVDVLKVTGLLLGLGLGILVAVVEDDAAIGNLGADDGTKVVAPYLITRHGIDAHQLTGLAGPDVHLTGITVKEGVVNASTLDFVVVPGVAVNPIPVHGVDEVHIVVSLHHHGISGQGIGCSLKVFTRVVGQGSLAVHLVPGYPQHTGLAADGVALEGLIVESGEEQLGNRCLDLPVPPLLAVYRRGVAHVGHGVHVAVVMRIPNTVSIDAVVGCKRPVTVTEDLGAVFRAGILDEVVAVLGHGDVGRLLQEYVHRRQLIVVGLDELDPFFLKINKEVVDARHEHPVLTVDLTPLVEGDGLVDPVLVNGEVVGDAVSHNVIIVAAVTVTSADVVPVSTQLRGEAEGVVHRQIDVVEVIDAGVGIILHLDTAVGVVVVLLLVVIVGTDHEQGAAGV